MSSQPPLPPPSTSNTDIPRLTLQRTTSTLPPPLTFLRNGHPSPHRSPSLGAISVKKRPSGSLIPGPLAQAPPPLPMSIPHPGQNPHVKPIVPDTPPPFPKKVLSRPPSVGSPEEVTPWDFHTAEPATFASPTSDNSVPPTPQSKSSPVKSKPPSLKSARQPSVRSRSSSTATRLVEEVTPWELYPPIPEKNTKYHITSQAIPEQTTSMSQTTLTGSVEEVTPWELVPPPETSRKAASRAPSDLKSVDEVSMPQSFDSEERDYVPSSPGSPAIQPSHISNTSSQDKIHKTGPAEDVTPWELEPGPTNLAAENSGDVGRFTSGRLRSSLTLAQVEDITPWELHPASSVQHPTDNIASEMDRSSVSGGGVIKKKHSRSGNPFAANNKTLSELAFVRGRKHGSLPSKSWLMSSSIQSSKHRTPIEFLPTRSYDDGGEGVSETLPTHAATNSSMLMINAPSSPAISILTRSADPDTPNKSQFNPSTADRKILSQLEFVKDAHDKEFILKGKGYQQQGGGVTPGKLHHVYHEKDAPYPRCYDSRAQDLAKDVWEIMVCHQICESWTWHVFEIPPRTVLDIGCGTGSWIIHAAGEWKDCHFWGIDLVPIQPDFNTLGDRDLKERVHWVHYNFLNGLPFEDEQFDYIHIKRIGLGVPENKWDALFEECKRVLKSGGAFEMIEEDLFFPGRPNDNSEMPRTVSMELDHDRQRWSSQNFQMSNDRVQAQSQPTSPSGTLDTLATPVSSSSTVTVGSPLTPINNPTSMSHILPEPSAVSPDSTKASLSPIPSNELSHNSNSPVSPSHVASQPGLTAKPTLYVKTPSNPQANSRFSNSAVSLLNAFGHHASASGGELAAAIHKRRHSGLAVPSNDDNLHAIRSQGDQSLVVQHELPAGGIPAQSGKQPTKSESYLLKQYKAPMNPRDHTILDTIYTEMLSSRFINAAPLSLLQNYLEYHFTDIRTHPPVLYSFPPTALLHSESRYVTDSEVESESSDEVSSDDDEARDAIKPKRPKHKNQSGSTNTRRLRYRSKLGGLMDKDLVDMRVLSRRDLNQHQSPYVSFDNTRAYAFSPSTPGKQIGPMRISRLPNAALNIDLKTLNMHLHLRTVDILGCSEPMWEWVLQYQADLAKKKTLQGPNAGQRIRPMQSETSLESTASSVPMDPVMNGIAELTREDYEILLANFEMDMQDQASIDYALQEQVNWHVLSSPRDLQRKAFDEACKKWDKWVTEQEKRARYLANHRHHAESGETRNGNPGLPEQHRYSCGGLLTPSASRDGIIHKQSSGEVKRDKGSTAKQDLSPLNPVPFSPSRLPPHQRLSRAFRVFVAWKARDPNSPNQAVPTSTGFKSPAAPA